MEPPRRISTNGSVHFKQVTVFAHCCRKVGSCSLGEAREATIFTHDATTPVNGHARMPLLHLSPPDIGALESIAASRAIDSGWVAPLGPEVDAFEAEVAAFIGARYAVALSSGTAALHLALLIAGVRPGDTVVTPTFTFGATAFAVTYVGASPIFVDSEATSWNLDPNLLDEVLTMRARAGQLPSAVITVDLFGQTADYESISSICARHDIPMIEDAAEALGASYGDRMAGSFGQAGIFSFNGNKIMTTSGGGMFVTDDESLADRVRYLATQARQPLPWYEHEDIGYNYRLSNILAALGRAQLQRLPEMIAKRRAHRDTYRRILGEAGVPIREDAPWGMGNAWLTVAVFDDPTMPVRVREALAGENIEARPVWKPMHMQPVFATAERHLTGVAEDAFARGLCLPSGSAMSHEDCERVARLIVNVVTRA